MFHCAWLSPVYVCEDIRVLLVYVCCFVFAVCENVCLVYCGSGRVFFWCPCFLSLKCLRMCVLYIVSTRVYAVFNCVCIIRSSVCSVYVSYAAEARGRRMLLVKRSVN